MVQTRRGLEIIIDAASTLYDFKSMQRLAEGVLTQIASLLNVDCAGILVLRDSGNPDSRLFDHRRLRLLQQLRRNRHLRRSLEHGTERTGRCGLRALQARLRRASFGALCPHRQRPRSGRAAATPKRQLSTTDRTLVEIFASRLSVAFDNVILYAQLHEANTLLEERVVQRTRAPDIRPTSAALGAMELRLQRVNAFKNEVLGTVAHDLKNPLSVILGRTEMLKDLMGTIGGSKESVLAQVDHIRDARRKRMTGMVDQSDLGCDGGRLRHQCQTRADQPQ